MEKKYKKILLGILITSLITGCSSSSDSGGTPSDWQEESNSFWNKEPEADAGENQNVIVGDLVTLDGSDSSDGEGDTLTYIWTVTDKPDSSNVVLTNETSVNPSFVPDVSGEYGFSLKVHDGRDESRSADYVYIMALESIITHNGLEYGVLLSETTGRKWLDRNIGSPEVCSSYWDEDCYGFYFQWGRDKDGHEQKNSLTSDVKISDITSSNSRFITSIDTLDWADVDSDGNLRSIKWTSTNGYSVCPEEFRVPTIEEIEAEKIKDSWGGSSNDLNIPAAGYKNNVGKLVQDGNQSYIWSTSIDDLNSSKTFSYSIYKNSASRFSDDRIYGQTVRCIKD